MKRWPPCSGHGCERVGYLLLALRHCGGWRQTDLVGAPRVPRSVIGRIESGRGGEVRLGDIDRVATALGARLDVALWWHGERLDRIRDAVHGALVEEIVRRLRAAGWIVEPEITFEIRGERGSIDVLAWHPQERLLLVVEVKSAFGDLQATLMTINRKSASPRSSDIASAGPFSARRACSSGPTRARTVA